MAEQQAALFAQGSPSPAELLRAALEKIVFFEWRLAELAAELSSAQSRCASAAQERGRAEEEARAADRRAKAARLELAELEAERSRLAALLSRPARGAIDVEALEAERARSAQLQAELAEARQRIEANRAERERWLSEMIAQARSGDEAPAALAQFISELRGEIIALRDRQRQSDAMLAQAGLSPPAPPPSQPPHLPARREPDAVEQARQLWAEGRIGGSQDAALAQRAAPVHTTPFATPQPRPSAPPLESHPREPGGSQGIAARALADQCLRTLTADDPRRREQAARHLAALPLPAAAPVLASALGAENDPKARAQMARALVACGGEGAAAMVVQLQATHEPPLVRLAAAEALCALPSCARAALVCAAQDPAPAVRRRAAALSALEGFDDLLARLSADADASVRAACASARREAPAPGGSRPPGSSAVEKAPEPLRDPAADVLQAVQAALFGLTEDEIAERIGVPAAEARSLAEKLLAAGRLGRRGKRLILAEGALQ